MSIKLIIGITLLQAPYSKQCLEKFFSYYINKRHLFQIIGISEIQKKKKNLIICIMITFPQQHYSYYYIYRWTDSQIILVLQNSSSDTLQNQLPCPWLSMKNSNKQVPRGILVPQLYCFACRNQ